MIRIYAAAAAALALAGGGAWGGWTAANHRRDSQELAIERAAAKATEAATTAAVTAIQAIEVRNVTIRQQAETITREVPVYRDGTCVHDQRMLDSLNEALAGQGAHRAVLPAEPGPAP